ncbi:MAG TPA: hypothetical protein VGG03_26305 [Thermoanaerobaculia bacterium]|jgi:hypothetical protein
MSGIQLLITGLCSFVPKYPLEKWKKHKKNEMTVLLVESAKPLPGHAGHTHEGHELHVPVLVCPEKYVVRDSGFRSPDATFQSTPYPENQEAEQLMAVFYLDDQEITIQPDQNTELDVDLASVTKCPSSDSNLSSFHWVSSLAKVNPGSEEARDSCFEPVCDSCVISRLWLYQGKITTAKLATDPKATDPKRKILLWYFDDIDRAGRREHANPGEEDEQAIAAVVGVHFDLDTGKGIEFTTSLLPDYQGHRKYSNRRVNAIFERVQGASLRIRLQPIDDVNPKVWIKNMPWLDILQLRPLVKKNCDFHFAHLYKLSKDPDVAKKVPCTGGGVCLSPASDPRHGAGIDCPIVRHARKSRTDRRG